MSGSEIDAIQLTPFVDALRGSTEGRLRHVLDLPPSVPLAWKQRDGEGLHVHVMVGEGDDRLELDLRAPSVPAWFSGKAFSASYRRFRDHRDPADDPALAGLLRRLHVRLGEADRATDSSGWESLHAALDRERAFASIKDRMLRMVTPEEAYVRLGFRCNQSCEFCWQDRSWPEPPTEYYHRWVDEIADAGRTRITFTGGEATIHRELIPLVERARERGMAVTVETNAIQLAKPGIAEGLRRAGVSTLFISFHSHIPEVSDAMTSAPKTHVRTHRGIEEALRAGLEVSLNCVVERRNVDHLAEHAEHIVEHFVRPFPDHPARIVVYSHPCSYYDQAIWEQNLIPLDRVRPHLVRAMQVLESSGVQVSGVGTCGFPPCLLKEHPEALRSLRRSEQAEGDIEGRVYAEVCDRCAFRPHCLGVRSEYLDRFGERGLQPFEALPDLTSPRRDGYLSA